MMTTQKPDRSLMVTDVNEFGGGGPCEVRFEALRMIEIKEPR